MGNEVARVYFQKYARATRLLAGAARDALSWLHTGTMPRDALGGAALRARSLKTAAQLSGPLAVHGRSLINYEFVCARHDNAHTRAACARDRR